MMMADAEMIPDKSLRAFNALCLHDVYLHQNKKLQAKIIDWAEAMLNIARQEWCDIRNDIIDAVIKIDRKEQAQNRGKARDNKYAPFREYFKLVQKEKFDEALKNGGKLTANGFAHWFLKNRANDMKIPYTENNKLQKLIRLAEANNREFKTPIECKDG
jgi:hypothetical protein